VVGTPHVPAGILELSFDWLEYLSLATKLAASDDEASQRSAISRAYYSLYITARRRLELSGVQIKGDQHRAVWDAYRSRSNPGQSPDECGRIAMRANTLKWRRVRADYEDDYPGISSEVQDQLQQASRLLEQLRQIPQERIPTPQEVEGARLHR